MICLSIYHYYTLSNYQYYILSNYQYYTLSNYQYYTLSNYQYYTLSNYQYYTLSYYQYYTIYLPVFQGEEIKGGEGTGYVITSDSLIIRQITSPYEGKLFYYC